MILWLNGSLSAAATARIDPADRGFLLGDGVFETLLAHDGAVAHLGDHLRRLRDGLAVLDCQIPYDDRRLAHALAECLTANRLQSGAAALRLTVSRGVGPRGLAAPAIADPLVMVSAQPMTRPAAKPVDLVTVSVRRNEGSPASRIKSLSYIDGVLARNQAQRRGGDDALLLNNAGRVAEASAANLVIVTADGVFTPPVADGALPGITRGRVLACAPQLGSPAHERPLTRDDLHVADAVGLCNSLTGLVPVGSLDGRALGTQDGRARLADLARALAEDARRRAQNPATFTI